jgi:hypothetical protein
MTPVWVVRKFPEGRDKPPVIISAWEDVYAAKHEAQRWESDSKVPHDYVEGVLIIAEHKHLA